MKIRSILFALSALALATPTVAQEAPETTPQYTIEQTPSRDAMLEPTPGKQGPSLMEEQSYVWLSRHFSRMGPDANGDNRDSNRWNLYMPLSLNNAQGVPAIEIRGYGQLFAPGMFYNLFRTVPNDTTGLMRNFETQDVLNDAAYYEQFKDAKAFTIDSMWVYWFKNPSGGTPMAGAKFIVFRSPNGVTDAQLFQSSAYRSGGVKFGRPSLPIAFEADISPEGIDSSIADGFINELHMVFDQPLSFEPGTFAMPFLVNDEAEAVSQPIGGESDVRDWQVMASYWARRSGTAAGFGTGQNYKALGLLMFRPPSAFDPDKDTIYSLFAQLRFGSGAAAQPAIMDSWMNFFGTVDINAGVKYHYGTTASNEGLGSPMPNPVSGDARLPFSLTEISNVKIDLFDIDGAFIRTIAEARYVPGHYSAPLAVGDLKNGTYVARMTAGQNVYSMKINVVR